MMGERSCKSPGRHPSAVLVMLGLLLMLGCAGAATGGQPEQMLEIAQTKLLSEHGSTRATRYAGTNKIVTIDQKTHVAWLDSISDTMVATYDHASGQWGRPVKVGSGTDNVVCDSKGLPWISLADPRSKAGPTIYHHDGTAWRAFCPAMRTSPKIPQAELSFGGSLTIDSQDRIYVALTRGASVVGGVQGDVILLHSADRGSSVRCLDVFPADARLPHTGLSLERPSGHHPVATPWLLFSTGEKGPDCFGKGILHRVHVVGFCASPGE